MDFMCWGCNEGDGADSYIFEPSGGDRSIGGGMGGGELQKGLWVHPIILQRHFMPPRLIAVIELYLDLPDCRE